MMRVRILSFLVFGAAFTSALGPLSSGQMCKTNFFSWKISSNFIEYQISIPELNLTFQKMKRILLPTDFSSVADNAMKYALDIAAKFKSNLLLYHVYSFHRSVDYDRNYPEDEQPYVKNLEQKMMETVAKIREKSANLGLQIDSKVEENTPYFLFKNKLAKNEVDLIVMGTKGATGLKKVIYGSVAATALETANVPVLVVPPERAEGIKRIVLATDLEGVSQATLAPFKKLAVAYNAKVTILRVNTSSETRMDLQDDMPLDGIERVYREVPLSQSINQSINDFVEKDKADLICMIRREKAFFESIFKKSITKTHVYNNHVPFLVLPDLDA